VSEAEVIWISETVSGFLSLKRVSFFLSEVSFRNQLK